jgi:hypothetical protein
VPGFEIDVRKLLGNRPADAVRRAAGVAAGVSDAVDGVTDRVAAPHADARVRKCTVRETGRLVAIADDRRTAASEAGAQGIEVALLRLAIGEREVCVRQFVPMSVRGSLRLGDELAVLAHEDDPAIAIVDWEAT